MQAARRLALGQWFTPPPVADLALTLCLEGQDSNIRLLDPTCGDGAFLARAKAAGLPASQLTGFDIDPAAVASARSNVPGACITHKDIFATPPTEQPWDVIVGNPPYVRQERLTPDTKRAIRLRLAADWPDAPTGELDRLVGRGDLAVACIAHALRLVRPGGRIAFVVSSALFDAGYAQALWSLVNRHGRLLHIIDAPNERWFQDAAVNAVIVVLERGKSNSAPVQIARLTAPTVLAAERVCCADDLAKVAQLRTTSANNPTSWAIQLRAPAVWFDFERAAGDALVPLADIATVRRGTTSGANELFYLSRQQAAAEGIEKQLLMPLVRSPREQGGQQIAIDPDESSYVAVVCPPNEDALTKNPGARSYFEARAEAAARPTLKARPYWWSLPVCPARLFLTKAYAARFVQRLSPRPIVADQRVYSVHPNPGIDVRLCAAVLNSTFTAFALESLGRASLGEGALEWTVADAAKLPVIDPRRLDAKPAVRALHAMAHRPIGDVRDERNRADRALLDRNIAAAAPAVLDLLGELHKALAESTEARGTRRTRAIQKKTF